MQEGEQFTKSQAFLMQSALYSQCESDTQVRYSAWPTFYPAALSSTHSDASKSHPEDQYSPADFCEAEYFLLIKLGSIPLDGLYRGLPDNVMQVLHTAFTLQLALSLHCDSDSFRVAQKQQAIVKRATKLFRELERHSDAIECGFVEEVVHTGWSWYVLMDWASDS